RDTDLGAESVERLANTRISQEGLVSTSGEGGGAIFIRGGEFVMDSSRMLAETLGDQDGVCIDVKVKSLSLTNGAQMSTSTGTSSSGKGGKLSVEADRVFLSGNHPRGSFPSGLFARASSTGDA